MNNTFLVLNNLLAIVFILYILYQAVLIRRTMRKCEPVHKKVFKVKGTVKWWRTRVYIIVLILYLALLILSLGFFDIRSFILLDISILVGYNMFPILFRYGKIGKKGVSISNQFIPWEDVEKFKLEWLPITHSFYPNGELTLTTSSHQTYIIIVEKTNEKEISDLLEK